MNSFVTGGKTKFLIICERDVGLFSMIQQVLSNIPWAIEEERIPVVYFRDRCCYWTPNNYHGKDTVWEYYFEPLVPLYSADKIPAYVRSLIDAAFPAPHLPGYPIRDTIWVTNHYGDHPALRGKTMVIPYEWDDPNDKLRQTAWHIIQQYLRPRDYIQDKVKQFFDLNMAGEYVVGVHIRGTDTTSELECRPHRHGSLIYPNYTRHIRDLLDETPTARIFVATDDQASVDYLKEAFGERVIAYDSIRHRGGEVIDQGPTGWFMPAYITGDRDRAAKNGEEAIIEYLLLTRCQMLIHNGSSLARTVLLSRPDMPHINTHPEKDS